MPRIYASNSDPIDFCSGCFPDLDEACEDYGVQEFGEGPDDRGDCFDYEADHPPYADECYSCEVCGVELWEKDD